MHFIIIDTYPYIYKIYGQLGPSPNSAPTNSAPSLGRFGPSFNQLGPSCLVDSAPVLVDSPLALVDSAPYKYRFGPFQKHILTLVKTYSEHCKYLSGLLQKLIRCLIKKLCIFSTHVAFVCTNIFMSQNTFW